MRVNILITGGGTGGHVYPALSIIRHLRRFHIYRLAGGQLHEEPSDGQRPETRRSDDMQDLAFVGSSLGLERDLVPRSGTPGFYFPMRPPGSPQGIALLAMATVRCLILILRTRPLVTFATGGYVSVPASVASWLLRVPLVLFLPDVVPGRAVRWLVPLARIIAVSSEDARRRLPADKVVVTGYPVREAFTRATRLTGRQRFEIPDEEVVLSVLGGSQGARSINEALGPCLEQLLSRYHVIHVSGPQRYEEARALAERLPADRRERYHLFPYLHEEEMADALAAADLVLCRSGASVLGELPAAGAPGLLVPFPDPAVHQRENAEYLARYGAAMILKNEDLSSRLCDVLGRLLADRVGLACMAFASRVLGRRNAAGAIAEIVRHVALGTPVRRV